MILIQLTGLSGAGKSTLARMVTRTLLSENISVLLIDGDAYRQTLCRDLGFSKADRQENIRRLARYAAEQKESCDCAIIAAINPYEEIREELRAAYHARTVWIRCSMSVLLQRDTKGLYQKALLPDGHPDKIYNLTGVNDPFEEPAQADLIIDTDELQEEVAGSRLAEFIRSVLQA